MKDEISSSLNHGLHIVVTIAEHVCDYVPKSVLKLLKHRLESLQLYGDQFIPGQLKKRVCQHMVPILNFHLLPKLDFQ